MKKQLSRTDVQEKIDEFFRQDELEAKYVKKIKRLAMKYNIKLGKYRRRFCKSCFSDLRDSIIRINKGYKTIICKNCEEKNRFRIS